MAVFFTFSILKRKKYSQLGILCKHMENPTKEKGKGKTTWNRVPFTMNEKINRNSENGKVSHIWHGLRFGQIIIA